MCRASIRVCGGVEIVEIAALDIDRADREPDRPVIEQVPVDQRIERLRERRGIVEAERLAGCPAPRTSARACRGEKKPGTPAVSTKPADHSWSNSRTWSLGKIGKLGSAARDQIPEGVEPFDALFRRVAREDRGIDRADRDAGDPVDLDPARRQPLDHARLIAAQRATALQHQRDGVGQGKRLGPAPRFRVRVGIGHQRRTWAARAAGSTTV